MWAEWTLYKLLLSTSVLRFKKKIRKNVENWHLYFIGIFTFLKNMASGKKHGLIKCQINRELHKIPTTTSNRKTARCTPCFHNARDIRRILITLMYFFHS